MNRGDPAKLEKPGPPALDEATAEQVRELITKGAMGMAAIITVDDIHKTYEELVAGEAELFAGAPLGKVGDDSLSLLAQRSGERRGSGCCS